VPLDFSQSDPSLNTAPELEAIALELHAREPLFHRPEHGTSREAFDAQMTPDFYEIGASGKRYSRVFVLDLLEERWSKPHEDVFEVRDFYCARISDNAFIATYTLVQKGNRQTRRTTIWQRSNAQWQAQLHQGTLVVPSD
jgi:hypothetical protein